MTKQLHDLNGKLVLIDSSDSKHPELAYQIPTLEQDRSTWLELSERCGGKLEEWIHWELRSDEYQVGSEQYARVIATPTPQTQDLSMKWVRFNERIPDDIDNVIVRRISNKQILSGHIWKLHSYYIETTIESGFGDTLFTDAEWLFESTLTRKS